MKRSSAGRGGEKLVKRKERRTRLVQGERHFFLFRGGWRLTIDRNILDVRSRSRIPS